jgi:hypothetical protein
MNRDTIRPGLLFKVQSAPTKQKGLFGTQKLYEAVSYPWTELPDTDADESLDAEPLRIRVMARTRVGDPTSVEVVILDGRGVRSLGVVTSDGKLACAINPDHTVYRCRRRCRELWCFECRGSDDLCPGCNDVGTETKEVTP